MFFGKMIDYNFWKKWENKTFIEKRAIKSVEKARQKIIGSVPREKLVAIYVKGSFVRREMRKNSDVDIVPIVTENKYESAIFGINGKYIIPSIVVPLSIQEFKINSI